MNEEEIRQNAEEFAKANKKRLAKELTALEKNPPESMPFSVFMAGSPGAGKTEFSAHLIEMLERNKKRRVVRVDGDELRKYIPGYSGANSYLFLGAISILVDRIHDSVLEQKQTFLLDGTFSKYERAVLNIERSLSRDRPILVFYVYQQPEVAWKFTQAREVQEGRHIPKDVFVQHFLNSRETVDRIRTEFDDRVSVYLVKKNFETHEVEDIIEIKKGGDSIDYYLGRRYTENELQDLL